MDAEVSLPGPDTESGAAPVPVSQGWANANVEGLGEVSGTIVGFDTKTVVIALDLPAPIVRGRAAVLALGIDGATVQGIRGTTLGVVQHPDGRRCFAVRLDTAGRVEEAPPEVTSKRMKARVQFDAKVDGLVVSSRVPCDKSYRFTAVDLSSQGLGALTTRDVYTHTAMLLRFPVPPHRGATLQLRGVVAHVQRLGEERIQVGFEFERVTSAQLTQLNNAIMHISHPTVARQALPSPRTH